MPQKLKPVKYLMFDTLQVQNFLQIFRMADLLQKLNIVCHCV